MLRGSQSTPFQSSSRYHLDLSGRAPEYLMSDQSESAALTDVNQVGYRSRGDRVAMTFRTHGTQVGAVCEGCLHGRGTRKERKSHAHNPSCGANPPRRNKMMLCGPTVSWWGRGREAQPRRPSPHPSRVPSESRHSQSPTQPSALRAARIFKTITCRKTSNPRRI